MNQVQLRWLMATLQSLDESSKLTIFTPEYSAELSRIRSVYASHRTIEFGINPQAVKTTTVTNEEHSLALDVLPEYPPYPVYGKYLSSWSEIGFIPVRMLGALIAHLKTLGIDLSTDKPLRRVWVAMPDVIAWCQEKPVYGIVKGTDLVERRTLKMLFQREPCNIDYSNAAITRSREPFAEIGDIKFFTTWKSCDRHPPLIFEGVEVGEYERGYQPGKKGDPYWYKVYGAQYDENRRIMFVFFEAQVKTPVRYGDKEVLTLEPNGYVIGKLID